MMKLGKVQGYRIKNGVPTRLQITLVGYQMVWLKGRKVRRKVSITRHLRLGKYSNEYRGRAISDVGLIDYGKFNDEGKFVLTAFKENTSNAVKAEKLNTLALVPV